MDKFRLVKGATINMCEIKWKKLLSSSMNIGSNKKRSKKSIADYANGLMRHHHRTQIYIEKQKLWKKPWTYGTGEETKSWASHELAVKNRWALRKRSVKICLALIKSIDNGDINAAKFIAKELLDEFGKKDHLFIKDIYLINSIFFLFPIDSAHLTISYVEKALEK